MKKLSIIKEHPQINTAGLSLYYKIWSGTVPVPAVGLHPAGNGFFDYSLNGAYSRLVSAPPLTYPGCDLDGAADYIHVESLMLSTFRSSFSAVMWVKPADGVPAENEVLMGTHSDTLPIEDQVIVLIDTVGKISFSYTANDAVNVATATENVATFSDGAQPWTCIIVTAEADTALKIYVNGVLQALDAVSDGDATALTFADYTSTCKLNFGALNSDDTPDDYGYHFDGLIDDCMIFDRLLSAAEVRSIYEVTRWRYAR